MIKAEFVFLQPEVSYNISLQDFLHFTRFIIKSCLVTLPTWSVLFKYSHDNKLCNEEHLLSFVDIFADSYRNTLYAMSTQDVN